MNCTVGRSVHRGYPGVTFREETLNNLDSANDVIQLSEMLQVPIQSLEISDEEARQLETAVALNKTKIHTIISLPGSPASIRVRDRRPGGGREGIHLPRFSDR